MYLYQPNPIIIPENCESERVVSPAASFTSEERERLDRRTIFYDVFVDPGTQKLRAIGPPLFNLRQELFPMEVLINGRPVTFRLDEIDRASFLETNDRIDDANATLTVEFRFKTFAETFDLNWQEIRSRLNNFSDATLTITTLQKDNPYAWIRDWFRWHARLYGAHRLILYDNGSSDRDELVQRLGELITEACIIFVDWRFPYGVDPYEYAQTASLNHARMMFPVSGGYCINLDVDEYLVKPDDEELLDYVHRKLARPELGAVAFTQYVVPNVVRDANDEFSAQGIPRFFHFPYRYRKPGHPGKGKSWSAYGRMKYIYDFDRIGYNAVHRTASEKNRSFAARYTALSKMRYFARKLLWTLLGKLAGDRMEKPRIDTCYASANELYVLHFMGLNTGWKSSWMTDKTSFDDAIHVEEPLISKLAQRVEMIPKPGP